MPLVNPAGTSQDHSNCCHTVNKELSHCWHLCRNWGCSLDRDSNAAINIQKDGRAFCFNVVYARRNGMGYCQASNVGISINVGVCHNKNIGNVIQEGV
ncbi:MAG: hypothetical protein EBV05_05895 [Cyanobacteria bacterium WB6_1B_304]|jgi:hypothetical protein|nr:hypothetical protein [Cyanobacteria bacterium WB6_1B_304]